jgi:hypothetical protein
MYMTFFKPLHFYKGTYNQDDESVMLDNGDVIQAADNNYLSDISKVHGFCDSYASYDVVLYEQAVKGSMGPKYAGFAYRALMRGLNDGYLYKVIHHYESTLERITLDQAYIALILSEVDQKTQALLAAKDDFVIATYESLIGYIRTNQPGWMLNIY